MPLLLFSKSNPLRWASIWFIFLWTYQFCIATRTTKRDGFDTTIVLIFLTRT